MEDEHPVELYVYDLSQGLARQVSLPMLGIQIEAVYHTSIVVGGIEYYFGHGVQTSAPGSSHHGVPIEIIPLGVTSLSKEIIAEYVESMKSEYSLESYDLFLHNCNNFTSDLTMFLCVSTIPEHIKTLPQTILGTPFGQMLRPILERQMRPVTEVDSVNAAHSIENGEGHIESVATNIQFEKILESGKEKCVVAFFSSNTCPPCRIIYPYFKELAIQRARKFLFVKVDIDIARDVAMKYRISVTPTFITWSKGEKFNQWNSTNKKDLTANVQMLIATTYPPHPHTNIDISTILKTPMQPILFSKVPPLEKVATKLGSIAQNPAVLAHMNFLKVVVSKGTANTPLPDLEKLAKFIQASLQGETPGELFPLVDLFRASLADVRVSEWFAQEKEHRTINMMLKRMLQPRISYSLRLVTIQAICNLFVTHVFADKLLSSPNLTSSLIQIVTTSLLDKDHAHIRVAGSSLAFNIAVHIQRWRSQENREILDELSFLELIASFIETLNQETESKEVLSGITLSLALGVYCAPLEGEVLQLVKLLGAGKIMKEKAVNVKLGEKMLFLEVARLLETSEI